MSALFWRKIWKTKITKGNKFWKVIKDISRGGSWGQPIFGLKFKYRCLLCSVCRDSAWSHVIVEKCYPKVKISKIFHKIWKWQFSPIIPKSFIQVDKILLTLTTCECLSNSVYFYSIILIFSKLLILSIFFFVVHIFLKGPNMIKYYIFPHKKYTYNINLPSWLMETGDHRSGHLATLCAAMTADWWNLNIARMFHSKFIHKILMGTN